MNIYFIKYIPIRLYRKQHYIDFYFELTETYSNHFFLKTFICIHFYLNICLSKDIFIKNSAGSFLLIEDRKYCPA